MKGKYLLEKNLSNINIRELIKKKTKSKKGDLVNISFLTRYSNFKILLENVI